MAQAREHSAVSFDARACSKDPHRQPRRDRLPRHPHRARRMGIATVAVYSDADRDAPPRRDGRRGGAHRPAAVARVLPARPTGSSTACKATGAEAVHPGLRLPVRERERSRATLEAAGIVFIGPKHASIAAMGDKIASQAARGAAPSVNTIPGYTDVIADADEAVTIAQRRRLSRDDQGRPPAAAARACASRTTTSEAREGFAACQAEAKASFGDDRVFVEKFIEEPRHIEIQVLGDAHGNVVSPGRARVLDPAPAPEGDRGGAVAVPRRRHAQGDGRAGGGARARRSNYQSAGTVEFVVDADRKLLLPRDEHAAAGRASGHRDGHRARPRRAA